jgi:hypothetical protein
MATETLVLVFDLLTNAVAAPLANQPNNLLPESEE